MLLGMKDDDVMHVRFVSYTGTYPTLCSGVLTLNIDGEDITFGHSWSSDPSPMYPGFWSSGGGLQDNYEGSYEGEWLIYVEDIPEKYRRYSTEINHVFNQNVPWGCCGGCI